MEECDMIEDNRNDRPSCFGDPATVCPKDEQGFIQPRQECLACPHQRECLRTALRAEGKLEEPSEPAAPAISKFLKRWSDRKLSKE